LLPRKLFERQEAFVVGADRPRVARVRYFGKTSQGKYEKGKNMESVEKSIMVDVPVSTAYNQWTQFEEFPEFMDGVEEVRQEGDTHLFWQANIGGKNVEWEAEIFEQRPDEQISWRSTTGAYNAGTVRFEPSPDGGTRVFLRLEYEPEGFFENVGSTLGFVDRRVEGDLERFKEFIEDTGRETGAWRGEVHGGAKAKGST
jgi:uncharacterized membrane protein